MKKTLLIEKENKKIYSIDEAKINQELIKSLLERMGYQTIRLNSLQAVLEQMNNFKKKENKKEFDAPSFFLEENVSDPHMRNVLQHFHSASDWFMYLLNQSKIGFCIIDKSKYLVYNQHLKQIIRIREKEMKQLTPGELALIQHRVKIRDLTRHIVTGKFPRVDLSFESLSGNREVVSLKAIGYRHLIDSHPAGVVYLYEENAEKHESTLKEQAINELHARFKQMMYNSLKKDNHLVDHPTNEQAFTIDTKDLKNELTRREKEVLRWISAGCSNKEIAENLHISIRTVEFHRSNLLSKTQSRNTAELVRFALNHQLADR